MPRGQARPLNRENYGEEIARLQGSFGRIGVDLGGEGSAGVLADAIGTLFWHFGEPEAAVWFERALDLYRRGTAEATMKVALLLWKLGRGADFRKECQRVLGFHDERLRALAAGEIELPGVQRLRARGEAARAHYCLGDYERARMSAGQALELGWEKRTHPADMTAIQVVAAGVVERDASAFVRGLEILRRSSPRWLTDGVSVEQDLYRYSLAVGARHFPEETRRHEPLGNGDGHGAAVEAEE